MKLAYTHTLVFTVTRTNSKKREKMCVHFSLSFILPETTNRSGKFSLSLSPPSLSPSLPRSLFFLSFSVPAAPRNGTLTEKNAARMRKHFAASNAVGQLSQVCNKDSRIIGSDEIRSLALALAVAQAAQPDRCKCKEIAIWIS